MEMAIIIFLILAVTLATCVLVIFARKNKCKFYILAGGICILLLCTFGIYQLCFYYNENQVEIHTSTEEDNTFVLPIKNHKMNYEYTYTNFITEMNMEELVEEIKKNNQVKNIELSSEGVIITLDNQVITIKLQQSSNFLWEKRYQYKMKAEFFNLSLLKGTMESIPFPTEFLETEGSYESVMNTSCSLEELKKFYKHFTNVSIEENGIIMKLQSGLIIKITMEGNKVKFKKENL